MLLIHVPPIILDIWLAIFKSWPSLENIYNSLINYKFEFYKR